MSFGLNKTPTVFQALVNKILQDFISSLFILMQLHLLMIPPQTRILHPSGAPKSP